MAYVVSSVNPWPAGKFCSPYLSGVSDDWYELISSQFAEKNYVYDDLLLMKMVMAMLKSKVSIF